MLGKWLGSILGYPWPPPYPTPKVKPTLYLNPYTESWPFPEKFPYPFPCGSPSRAMAVFKNFPAATVSKQKERRFRRSPLHFSLLPFQHYQFVAIAGLKRDFWQFQLPLKVTRFQNDTGIAFCLIRVSLCSGYHPIRV